MAHIQARDDKFLNNINEPARNLRGIQQVGILNYKTLRFEMINMKKLTYYSFIFVFLYSLSSYGAPALAPYKLKYDFYSDKNYQYVYRLILNNADSCSKQGVISKRIAEGQLYTELKAGDISISLIAPFGKFTHIRVKVKAELDKTKIIVTNDFEEWDELAKAIQDWVTKETNSCTKQVSG